MFGLNFSFGLDSRNALALQLKDLLNKPSRPTNARLGNLNSKAALEACESNEARSTQRMFVADLRQSAFEKLRAASQSVSEEMKEVPSDRFVDIVHEHLGVLPLNGVLLYGTPLDPDAIETLNYEFRILIENASTEDPTPRIVSLLPNQNWFLVPRDDTLEALRKNLHFKRKVSFATQKVLGYAREITTISPLRGMQDQPYEITSAAVEELGQCCEGSCDAGANRADESTGTECCAECRADWVRACMAGAIEPGPQWKTQEQTKWKKFLTALNDLGIYRADENIVLPRDLFFVLQDLTHFLLCQCMCNQGIDVAQGQLSSCNPARGAAETRSPENSWEGDCCPGGAASSLCAREPSDVAALPVVRSEFRLEGSSMSLLEFCLLLGDQGYSRHDDLKDVLLATFWDWAIYSDEKKRRTILMDVPFYNHSMNGIDSLVPFFILLEQHLGIKFGELSEPVEQVSKVRLEAMSPVLEMRDIHGFSAFHYAIMAKSVLLLSMLSGRDTEGYFPRKDIAGELVAASCGNTPAKAQGAESREGCASCKSGWTSAVFAEQTTFFLAACYAGNWLAVNVILTHSAFARLDENELVDHDHTAPELAYNHQSPEHDKHTPLPSRQHCIWQKDRRGRTPLMLACCTPGIWFGVYDGCCHFDHTRSGVANQLTQKFSDKELQINDRDQDGQTALLYAGINSLDDAFRIILRDCETVDVNVQDPLTGNTAFLWLLHRNLPEGRPRWDAESHSVKVDPWPTFLDEKYDPVSSRSENFGRALRHLVMRLRTRNMDMTVRNHKGEDWRAVAEKHLDEGNLKLLTELMEMPFEDFFGSSDDDDGHDYGTYSTSNENSDEEGTSDDDEENATGSEAEESGENEDSQSGSSDEDEVSTNAPESNDQNGETSTDE